MLLEQLLVVAAGEATLGRIGARINAAKKSPARAVPPRAKRALRRWGRQLHSGSEYGSMGVWQHAR
uniref:Uncharacterized protein n=1 Tax=mine drainage metagenome TaxID=410659 RepID=E6Q5Y5_9ZZZZ